MDPTAKARPTAQTERIVSLDVLRGFALLGILVMNVQSFSMIGAAYMNPNAYGDLTGANWLVWLFSHVLFDMKFMAIFSMLFGAGIVLFSERLLERGRRPAGLHYRRMFWLMLFGLMHAHLIWYGDILFLYAICGMWVYWLRRLPPAWLIVAGLVVLLIGTALFLFFGWSMQFWPEEPMAEMRDAWLPAPGKIASEVEAYRGGWLSQMSHRVPAAVEFETFILIVWGLWRASGLMLIGMGLYKLGVFSARRSRSFYATVVAAGALVGVPVVAFGVYRNVLAGWDMSYSFFYGSQINYWGSILVSLGYVGAIMLLCRARPDSAFARRLAAVGQMAFTNYILQSVLATLVFYGHGLGLFGRVERTGQIAIVAAIWIVQLVLSPIWLRRFRFGPLEWLWRSLSYWKRQPMRREPAAPAA